jgi:hypothetical protein
MLLVFQSLVYGRGGVNFVAQPSFHWLDLFQSWFNGRGGKYCGKTFTCATEYAVSILGLVGRGGG